MSPQIGVLTSDTPARVPLAVYGRYQVQPQSDPADYGVWYVKRDPPVGHPKKDRAGEPIIECICTSERQCRRVAAALAVVDVVHWLFPILQALSDDSPGAPQPYPHGDDRRLPPEARAKLDDVAVALNAAWRP